MTQDQASMERVATQQAADLIAERKWSGSRKMWSPVRRSEVAARASGGEKTLTQGHLSCGTLPR